MGRALVLSLAVLFVALFGFLTVREAITAGPTPLVILSFVFILVLGFGVIGALSSRSDE